MITRLLLPTLCLIATAAAAAEPIVPQQSVPLFNGKNLTGFATWLKDTKREDPRNVFTAHDGLIHVSGDGFGYLATDKDYRNYRLSLEFKWGKRTDGGKYVRNSGVLLHGTGPDGAANGAWMASIECQLAQGCVGDMIAIRTKDIPVTLKAETVLGPDKRPRWKKWGEVRTFPKGQLWWSLHDPDYKELLDTRGKNDVESPLGEWTRVECACADKRIQIKVNDVQVNEAFDVFPASGKILLQSEGFEIYFRKVEIHPLR